MEYKDIAGHIMVPALFIADGADSCNVGRGNMLRTFFAVHNHMACRWLAGERVYFAACPLLTPSHRYAAPRSVYLPQSPKRSAILPDIVNLSVSSALNRRLDFHMLFIIPDSFQIYWRLIVVVIYITFGHVVCPVADLGKYAVAEIAWRQYPRSMVGLKNARGYRIKNTYTSIPTFCDNLAASITTYKDVLQLR